MDGSSPERQLKPNGMTEEYSHTQIGYGLAFAYVGVSVFLGALIVMTGFSPIYLVGLVVMLAALGVFATLTVEVSKRMIRIRFGLGFVRLRFLLEDIQTYQVVKNPWYYGWGIRYTPRGWLYNISGFSAIELQMKSGKRVRIGTDEPEELARALGAALQGLP